MRWGQEIQVRGARVHNLKDVDVDVPLGQIVGLTGVSGSGKSSLALGVLYAEGSRRYLEALSSYTRRRISQSARADVDLVEGVPSAIALHQRPSVPGVRSTFGTATELLNSLRLLYSRLGSHLCPNGHHVPPSRDVAATGQLTCPECGETFAAPGAEDFAFNSAGACERCAGTGEVRQINQRSLVPDPSLSILDGAVAAWGIAGATLMKEVAPAVGIRVDVPFRDLTPEEQEHILHGPSEKRVIMATSSKGNVFELNATFRNANQVIEEALAKADSEAGYARLEKFIKVGPCPECQGSRLNARARGSLLEGRSLVETTAWTLRDLTGYLEGFAERQAPDLQEMARQICQEFLSIARPLLGLGLSYLAPGRASRTLSTGELQRVQLSRTVRSRTTGVLYVLDEPSIGLHPANVDALLELMTSLVEMGNSVVLVDHDVRVLKHAQWLIEIGPGAGAAGGTVIASGTPGDLAGQSGSRIGPFLAHPAVTPTRSGATAGQMFEYGRISISTDPLFTLKPLTAEIPIQRLTAVTGASGSGKTTLILESLVASLQARQQGAPMPEHVRSLNAPDIVRTVLVDAVPIGRNVRSTVGTYTGILDELRKAYARTAEARRLGLGAADFSYNTGSLRCPVCEGTGQISLDVQFLPDVDINCPECEGTRYGPAVNQVQLDGLNLAEALGLTVSAARNHFHGLKKVQSRLKTLEDIGLGYLTLGEATPALSGGEAQRLKLVEDLEKPQAGTLFVFDEPSVGLHPLDIQVLLGVLDRLLDAGATVVVIEHDIDMIVNADYVIDLGPGGGSEGGRIVATGTPAQIAATQGSLTGKYLAEAL